MVDTSENLSNDFVDWCFDWSKAIDYVISSVDGENTSLVYRSDLKLPDSHTVREVN